MALRFLPKRVTMVSVNNSARKQPIHLTLRLLADVIYISQANLVMENGVHSSLHPNCHYLMIFAKSDLSILYSPTLEITVRYYEKADTEVIRR